MTALLSALPDGLEARPATDRFATAITTAEPARAIPEPLGPLSRVRGGTYSSTVDLIRFTDQTTARTDLIRLTPNVDAYSLNHAGISPRQLSHYREVPWRSTSLITQSWQDEITHILANSFPHVRLAELSRRLREAGYPIGSAELREHEAIAATQAALWYFTNDLELDTEPVDAPASSRVRIGVHPSARELRPTPDGRLASAIQVPAGESAYLEVAFAGRPQVRAYQLELGGRTARHEFTFALEASFDGQDWQPVSSSQVQAAFPGQRRVHRRLGLASTLSDAHAAKGERGYRHYRLAVTGPAGRDSLVEITDFSLHLSGASSFRNNDRVVYLYDYLIAAATGQRSRLRPSPSHSDDAEATGLSGAPARVHARVLAGSRSPGGPSEFTLLVAATPDGSTTVRRHGVPG